MISPLLDRPETAAPKWRFLSLAKTGCTRSQQGHRTLAVSVLLALLCLFQSPVEAANALSGNPSPYLAMHGEDPVAWREWGPETLAEAREQGKPLFVSSGYFACHWCHVMQRESYRDPAIAALLNRHFVPVKLDRELHPALDAYLIGFVERTAGQAGWPLNVFLSPDGYPLLGLTYAPPERFEGLLRRVAEVWAEQGAELAGLARRGAEERAAELWPAQLGPMPSLSPGDLARRLTQQALRLGDDLTGGFGRQTRFPMAPNLSALLELQERAPDESLAAFLRLTLDEMARQGLRDHLGGGFFRYTVDPDWKTPHFEKMLYTQALLVPLYLKGARVLERAAYREIARETLDFLLEGMGGTDGGFISSLSAVDADGVEGGYYLWRPAQLERLLDLDERRLLALVWGVEGPPRHEAGYLPIAMLTAAQAAAELGLVPEDGVLRLATARAKLLAARNGRSLPRDEKQVAGWNGLVLSALAAGANAFGDVRYRNAAGALRDFLVLRLWDGSYLHRAASDRGWIGDAALEDYAFVAKGLWDWSRVGGSGEDLGLARRLVALAWERFRGDDGWRSSANPLLPAVPAEPAFPDSPLPSPAAILIGMTLEGEDEALAKRALEALHGSLPVVGRSPFAFAGQTLLLIANP